MLTPYFSLLTGTWGVMRVIGPPGRVTGRWMGHGGASRGDGWVMGTRHGEMDGSWGRVTGRWMGHGDASRGDGWVMGTRHGEEEIACSGQERTASATLSSWSTGTSSLTGEECPSISSSWNTFGAIMLQSVCPWHFSGST